MKKHHNFYFQLFWATFTLSAFTLGGGYVIVPLMKKKFVDQYGWIHEKEMLDMVAIAQSSPGAIAVNTSLLVGYRLGGIFGAGVSLLGTILPPLLVLSLVSLFYESFKENLWVRTFLKAMGVGVVAVIADVVLTMGKSVVKEKSKFSIFMMLFSFFLLFFFKMDIKLIILGGGLLGLAYQWIFLRKERS
jgi:chromate transporter